MSKIDKSKDIQDVDEDFINKGACSIAIIGMSGVFPGAKSVQELWSMLKDGRDGLIPAFEEEGMNGFVTPVNRAYKDDPEFVSMVYGLKNKARFDAAFFNISPHEAEIMDPQHRLFLEMAWTALEHACIIPDKTTAPVGVYGSCGFNSYLFNNLPAILNSESHMSRYLEVLVGNDKEYLATRTSYKLNLTGPSMVVQSACSSSLTAVILACQGLQDYQCDIALAGGSSIQMNQDAGFLPEEGSPVSKCGIARPFDEGADGVAGGSGCAIVVLKRLEDAIEDNDVVYSVIRGYGLNNDGSDKVSFTAPSVGGQARAIAEAIADAGIEPADIGYVECHGTGTHLGDPIEISSLVKAFKIDGTVASIPIGSIKGNVGHLDTAAGVASLIKAALALYYEEIPPSIYFEKPNQSINFDATPFKVCVKNTPWLRKEKSRYAAISSFGFGGTNTHIILQESPKKFLAVHNSAKPVILPISAGSDESVTKLAYALSVALPEAGLLASASVLANYRKRFESRAAVVTSSVDGAICALKQECSLIRGHVHSKLPHIVYMFGISKNYSSAIIQEFYQNGGAFAQTFDRLLEKTLQVSKHNIQISSFSSHEYRIASDTEPYYNAYLFDFILEMALSSQFMEWGIIPDNVCGHNLGEFSALCFAGVMLEENILSLLVQLGELSSLSVDIPMNTAAEILQRGLSEVIFSLPTIPVLFADSNEIITSQSIIHRHFWSERLINNVFTRKYEEKISIIPKTEATVILEFASEKTGEKSFICNTLSSGSSQAMHICLLPFIGEHKKNTKALVTALEIISFFWVNGIEPDWSKLPEASLDKVGLPGYPFEGKRYWHQPDTLVKVKNKEMTEREHLDDWFMEPVWYRAPYLSTIPIVSNSCWLIMSSEKTSLLAKELAVLIDTAGGKVVHVLKGDTCSILSKNRYTMRPSYESDMEELFQNLLEHSLLPQNIVMLWGLDAVEKNVESPLDKNHMADIRACTFDTQIFLIRQLSIYNVKDIHITICTSSMFDVTGEQANPLMYMAQAPLLVSNWEHTGYTGSIVDFDTTVPPAEFIFFEACSHSVSANYGGGIVRAYRNKIRFIRDYISTPIPEKQTILKLEGCVFISGGLGGIGLGYAKMLARNGVSTLVLAGRTPLVDQVKKLEIGRESTEDILWQLEEETGVIIHTVSLDCTDAFELETVISEAEKKYGTFCGVVHAAGVEGGGMMAVALPRGTASNFHAKVSVLAALDTVFSDRPLRFMHLCSSQVAIQGALGHVDNCAANLVLDGFAAWAHKKRPWSVTSINWDRWQGIGMARTVEKFYASLTGHKLLLGMQEEDALEAARRLLGSVTPQVLVSNHCPFKLAHMHMESAKSVKEAKLQSKSERIDTGVDYVAPRDDLETVLVQLWALSLGTCNIGIHDEFMQLGGDSLLAITLIGRISKAFRTRIPLRILFEVKTIAILAEWLRKNEVKPSITDNIAAIICSTQ